MFASNGHNNLVKVSQPLRASPQFPPPVDHVDVLPTKPIFSLLAVFTAGEVGL